MWPFSGHDFRGAVLAVRMRRRRRRLEVEMPKQQFAPGDLVIVRRPGRVTGVYQLDGDVRYCICTCAEDTYNPEQPCCEFSVTAEYLSPRQAGQTAAD